MPSRRTTIGVMAAGLIAVTTTLALAQSNEGTTMTATTIVQKISFPLNDHLPIGYHEAGRRSVTVDGETAELVRYERSDARNAGLGGEHFSTVIANNDRLKGFARIDLDLIGRDLPSREEAQAIAMDFLQKQAPDLLPGMKLSWIDPHDEPLRVTRGGTNEDLTLTGMKVKMRNTADGLWFWVIVGANHKVMVFERDIHWIRFPGHRGTEKWLHDSWFVDNGHSLSAT